MQSFLWAGKKGPFRAGGGSLLICRFPAVLKAAWKSCRNSRLRVWVNVPGEARGGRGSPKVPGDSVYPREPDPAQGHCPHGGSRQA